MNKHCQSGAVVASSREKSPRALLSGVMVLLLCCGAPARAQLARSSPKPLANHPDNIFVAGEDVAINMPSGAGADWRLVDYDGNLLKEVAVKEGKGTLGKLGVGFYRLRPVQGSSNEWISLGIVAPLPTPTSSRSPVGLDVAMAWFYPRDKMEAAANLCALAGVNWVRDRLNWGQMEPQKGQFVSSNQYDASSLAQSRAGLQVLQVNHISPRWASEKAQRFPADLRHAYSFYREMARRWQGQVMAFEPWNEADIPMFGGHTGSEMASLQKAAWLGLKAGNPDVIACLNVFATHPKNHLEDLKKNEAWPYFDTFNLHHYEAFSGYAKLYADFRSVSAGKPLWVTECSVPVKWAGDEKLKEPSEADLRVQAERLAKTFAYSVHEGAAVTFYFMLPHYVEGQTQFGIVRPDLTPRPAYLTLAAVGRLMADALPLGQWTSTNQGVTGFFFKARPNGKAREVLVAWADKAEARVNLPGQPEAVYDHLGRPMEANLQPTLNSAPRFFVFRSGASKKVSLTQPPKAAEKLKGKPSPVVLQALFPAEKTLLKESAYRLSPNELSSFPLYVYNFSPKAVEGTVKVGTPGDYKVELAERVQLAAWERKEIPVRICPGSAVSPEVHTLGFTGDFGRAGRAVLSLRIQFEPGK